MALSGNVSGGPVSYEEDRIAMDSTNAPLPTAAPRARRRARPSNEAVCFLGDYHEIQ